MPVTIEYWSTEKNSKGQVAVEGIMVNFQRKGGYSLNETQVAVRTVQNKYRSEKKRGYITVAMWTVEGACIITSPYLLQGRDVLLDQRMMRYTEHMSEENNILDNPDERLIETFTVSIRIQETSYLDDDD
jgi:hypothetical protein